MGDLSVRSTIWTRISGGVVFASCFLSEMEMERQVERATYLTYGLIYEGCFIVQAKPCCWGTGRTYLDVL